MLLNKIISILLSHHHNNFCIARGGNLRLGNPVWSQAVTVGSDKSILALTSDARKEFPRLIFYVLIFLDSCVFSSHVTGVD